jgi:hypothetical protein
MPSETVKARIKRYGWNQSEVAVLLGLDFIYFNAAVKCGAIPAPEVKGKRRYYYTDAQIEQIKKIVGGK